MARYFMTGTKYEDFERMMMSPDRKGRDEGEDQNVTHASKETFQGEERTWAT